MDTSVSSSSVENDFEKSLACVCEYLTCIKQFKGKQMMELPQQFTVSLRRCQIV